MASWEWCVRHGIHHCSDISSSTNLSVTLVQSIKMFNVHEPTFDRRSNSLYQSCAVPRPTKRLQEVESWRSTPIGERIPEVTFRVPLVLSPSCSYLSRQERLWRSLMPDSCLHRNHDGWDEAEMIYLTIWSTILYYDGWKYFPSSFNGCNASQRSLHRIGDRIIIKLELFFFLLGSHTATMSP